MCYDIKAQLESQLKRARHYGDQVAIDEIMERLIPMTDLPLFHASGFSHPDLLIYTSESPDFPSVATWGLIPPWVKDDEKRKKIWNSTLNAKGETMFEKPSFKNAAMRKRCVIPVDGFYEYHHFNGKAYPFYIHDENNEPLYFAGLYEEWQKPGSPSKWRTFSIVTCSGNQLLSKIHNSPKLAEPRMPLILNEEDVDSWLSGPITNPEDLDSIENLVKPNKTIPLTYYTVGPLRGKAYAGNVPMVNDNIEYEALVFE